MSRIVSVDFTKGILVLLMVVYHSLNYLQSGTLPHDFLVFVPPSFIMITGFIVSHMYMQKYGGNLKAVSLRLGVRSVKIFLLFIALNAAARLVWSVNHYGVALRFENFRNDLIHMFLIGAPWLSAFDILLPISYTLAAAIMIVRVQSVFPSFPVVLAAAAFLLCTFLENASVSFYNLNMLSAGFIGMAAGLVPRGLLGRIRPPWAFVAAVLVLDVVAIRFVEDHYYTQMVVTGLAVVAILSAGSRVNPSSILTRQVATLGRYSLLSYIAQIFFLQLLKPAVSSFNVQAVPPMALISIITVLTWLSVLITDFARQRLRYIDVLYKAVFA